MFLILWSCVAARLGSRPNYDRKDPGGNLETVSSSRTETLASLTREPDLLHITPPSSNGLQRRNLFNQRCMSCALAAWRKRRGYPDPIRQPEPNAPDPIRQPEPNAPDPIRLLLIRSDNLGRMLLIRSEHLTEMSKSRISRQGLSLSH